MKVILTQEVKGKGGEGDVIEVARGFAVNYLFPRKMAIEATSGNLKQLEQRMHNIRTREEGRVGEAEAVAAALEGKKVVIRAKVGEEGRLFGSVTAHMIEEAIAEQLDVAIDRRKMDAHGHIKEVGEHVVSVQIYRDIKAHVTVVVAGEGVDLTEVAAAEAAVVENAEVEEAAEPDEAVVDEASADSEPVDDEEQLDDAASDEEEAAWGSDVEILDEA